MLSGRSKLYRYSGPQEKISFNSPASKLRGEAIAEEFKSKFRDARTNRGRKALEGTAKYTQYRDAENKVYNDMVTQMKSENLLFTPTTETTENPQTTQTETQISETKE